MKEDIISRRNFLKALGGGAVATATVMAGCTPKERVAEVLSESEVPTDKMTYRTSSRGDKVSLLGYGCMRFPTVNGVSGREDKNAELDQEAVNQLVDYALKHGVTLFDTSPAYCQGQSEKAVGIALSRYPRDKYLVSTKLSNFGDCSREESLKMYYQSFKELQVEVIDYYLLHAVGGGENGMQTLHERYLDNGMLDFLLQEREAGRIRHLGFSYHGDVTVFDYLLSRHPEIKWDFVLIQLNYVDWKHAKQMNERNTDAEYLYNELSKRNIQAFVMEPLLGGSLAQLNEHAVALLKQKDSSASVASWAFRFAGSKENVLTVLSGMTFMEHLQDNLRTMSPLKPLNEEEEALLEKIAEIYVNYPVIPCTGCEYCMPCHFGIDIPGIFAHYNKCLNEGYIVNDHRDKEYKKARRAFLIGYDRKVPKLRQAEHCIRCGKCTKSCPQQIDIPREMKRIDQFTESLRRGDADLGSAVLMASLIRQLDEGNFSCVIYNKGEVKRGTKRGVEDLYDLVKSRDKILKDASIADKVVGKAAAFLMLLGGVKELRTHVICKSALDVLKGKNVTVVCDEVVDHIENRTKTDWCPLEKKIKNCHSEQEAWPLIEEFVNELKMGKSL